MWSIPPPPLALDSAQAAAWGAGGLVVGVLLLLWGRKLHRVFLGLGAGAAGASFAGEWATQLSGLDWRLAYAIAAGTAGILGVVMARIVWPVLAGALFAGAAGVTVLACFQPSLPADLKAATAPAGGDLVAWSAAAYVCASAAVQAVWRDHMAVLLGAMCPAGLVPLVIGLFRPRLATIFMTALVGSLSMICGPLVAAQRFWPELWASAWANPHVPAIVAGVMLLIGLLFQYRLAIAADRAKKAPKPGEAEKTGTKKSGQDEK